MNGHKLVPLVIDDQTSPGSLATGLQEAISGGAIGIVSDSPIMDLGAKYPQQAGVPVTGDSSDGSEWGTQPYTNMFGIGVSGSVDPKYPVSTLYSNVLKQYGKINVALYALGISPDSLQGSSAVTQSLQRGDSQAKVVVDDRSVPYTADTNFTTEALTAKQEGVNIVWSNLAGNDNAPLAVALQAGGHSDQGDLLPRRLQPGAHPHAGLGQRPGCHLRGARPPLLRAQRRHRADASGTHEVRRMDQEPVPDVHPVTGLAGGRLMMQGIQGAGANPTHASVIKDLRSITSWNGNGLLPFNIDYATGFGHMSSPNCIWLTKAEKNGYVPEGKNPVCGTYIPGPLRHPPREDAAHTALTRND